MENKYKPTIEEKKGISKIFDRFRKAEEFKKNNPQ